MGMKKEPVVTRNFAVCWAVMFFTAMFFFMMFTGMASYSENGLGLTGAAAGLLTSALIIGDLAARILCASRVDRWGKGRVAAAGMAMAAAVTPLYFVTGNPIALAAIRIVQGFVYGLAGTAINAAVVEGLPASRRGEGIGYFSLSFTISSAIGPFLCMWLLENGTYGDMFTLATVFAAAAAAIALGMRDDRSEFGSAPARSGISVRDFIEPSAVPLALVGFLFFFAYSGVLTFTSLYGEDIGMEEIATFFFVFVSVGTLVSRIFLGRIYDSRGENAALLPFFLLGIIGFFLYAEASEGWHLVFAGIFLGFLMAQLSSVVQSVVVRKAPKSRYSVAISTFNVFLDLSYCVGPMLHGALKDALGFRGNFLLMAAIAIADMALYIAVHGARSRGRPSELLRRRLRYNYETNRDIFPRRGRQSGPGADENDLQGFQR
jgi:MFS family permease